MATRWVNISIYDRNGELFIRLKDPETFSMDIQIDESAIKEAAQANAKAFAKNSDYNGVVVVTDVDTGDFLASAPILRLVKDEPKTKEKTPVKSKAKKTTKTSKRKKE